MKLDNLDQFIFRKRGRAFLILSGVLAMVWGASVLTQFDFVRAAASFPRAFQWAAQHFYPDEKAMSRLPQIFSSMWKTLETSTSAAAIGAIAAVVFAVLGSNTTKINGFFSMAARFTATLFRNIDVSIWALVLLFSFGQSGVTGFLALAFASFGFLTRAFIETIDEASNSSVEALKASGAGYLSIVCRAVLPSRTPQMISWLLYMIETNIRSATLVGILTGTGIGFSFDLYYKSLNYAAASLVVIVIVISILMIELISNAIRKIIV